MAKRVDTPGLKTSEFLALVIFPTLLVLCAPLVGYPINPDNIQFLLLMYTGYGGLRGGQKITSVVKGPKPPEQPKKEDPQ